MMGKPSKCPNALQIIFKRHTPPQSHKRDVAPFLAMQVTHLTPEPHIREMAPSWGLQLTPLPSTTTCKGSSPTFGSSNDSPNLLQRHIREVGPPFGPSNVSCFPSISTYKGNDSIIGPSNDLSGPPEQPHLRAVAPPLALQMTSLSITAT